MRIALLCPGPSLARTFPACAGGYDLVLAVNHAVLIARADWWVFADWTLFTQCDPDYAPRVFTTTSAVRGIERCSLETRFKRHCEPLLFEDRWPEYPGELGWTLWSACAGLVLGAHLGATYIDVYGADWTCEPDWDGTQLVGNNRGDIRWRQERVCWARLQVWLAETKGVWVQRIRETGPWESLIL